MNSFETFRFFTIHFEKDSYSSSDDEEEEDADEQDGEQEQEEEDVPLQSPREIWTNLRTNFTSVWLQEHPEAIDMAVRLNTLFKQVVFPNEPRRKQPRIRTSIVLAEVEEFGFDVSVVGRVLHAIYPNCSHVQFTKGGEPDYYYVCLRRRS